jgi:hypothetical protein
LSILDLKSLINCISYRKYYYKDDEIISALEIIQPVPIALGANNPIFKMAFADFNSNHKNKLLIKFFIAILLFLSHGFYRPMLLLKLLSEGQEMQIINTTKKSIDFDITDIIFCVIGK